MKYAQQTLFAGKTHTIRSARTVGIDIGSRQSKAVLLADGLLYTSLAPTGFSMRRTAAELLEELFSQSGISVNEVDYIVATGYGRIALDFGPIPHRTLTEISCHGLGGSVLGENIRTIVDIGGQDSKVIRIDPKDGQVLDFAMNDKCAAGTGRFLEKTANLLGCEALSLGEISRTSLKPANISSQCVVFAESEIISGRAKGENVSDLAAGVHMSVARRVNNLISRVGAEPNVLFSGGVSGNAGMRKALEDLLGFETAASPLDAVYTGALGAALFAGQFAVERTSASAVANAAFSLDISGLLDATAKRQEDFIKKTTGKKRNVAYLCTYTPVEILSAADVAHIRMLHAGSQKEVSSGESITQSIFCDFTKSCLGSLAENYPLYGGIDKVYTFYTCDCMRKTAEAIGGEFVRTSIFNLPRLIRNAGSMEYYATEMEGFVNDLEHLARKKILREDIRKNVLLYNRARSLMREISGYRKNEIPPFGSSAFQKIAGSYYYLPAEELVPQLENIARQLREYAPPANAQRPIRLMLSGGIVADGDGKLTGIAESLSNVAIVVEDNCTGYAPFARDIELSRSDILRDIAAGYLSQAPCARMKPLSERVDFSANLAREYGVDGVIYYYMKFCPCYGMGKKEFISHFQKTGIPILDIPGDYSSGDEGQIKTRIEAFIEVLEERRLCVV
jgi:predicted CoA-substrate-specific enzyme activase